MAVFQPFTYSRTYLLMDDFAQVLSMADHVVMTEIMGSRERNTYNVYTCPASRKDPRQRLVQHLRRGCAIRG